MQPHAKCHSARAAASCSSAAMWQLKDWAWLLLCLGGPALRLPHFGTPTGTHLVNKLLASYAAPAAAQKSQFK